MDDMLRNYVDAICEVDDAERALRLLQSASSRRQAPSKKLADILARMENAYAGAEGAWLGLSSEVRGRLTPPPDRLVCVLPR